MLERPLPIELNAEIAFGIVFQTEPYSQIDPHNRKFSESKWRTFVKKHQQEGFYDVFSIHFVRGTPTLKMIHGTKLPNEAEAIRIAKQQGGSRHVYH